MKTKKIKLIPFFVIKPGPGLAHYLMQMMREMSLKDSLHDFRVRYEGTFVPFTMERSDEVDRPVCYSIVPFHAS